MKQSDARVLRVFKTLDMRQQRTVIPERLKQSKVSPKVASVYLRVFRVTQSVWGTGEHKDRVQQMV